MNLDELSASELAAIDSVCLEFERRFDSDQPLAVAAAMQMLGAGQPATVSREHLQLLQQELLAIETELTQRASSRARTTSTTTLLQSKVGHAVGPYAIDRILAQGGMGIVYHAVDTRLDRPVAIKMMGFPDLPLGDPKRIELVDRFEREAKAVAALSHPNIVELFDVGAVEGTPYAVMEFLDGRTLADELDERPMSVDQARQIGMQIAGALATAHASGVVHRDLKPQNVMLVVGRQSGDDRTPRVKLVDFGLSRVSDTLFQRDGDDQGKTRSGMILGTPGYMAPEQARGEPATSAADLFAFGCVLYEMVYGKPAIPGDTPADRLAGTLRGEVRYERIPDQNRGVPHAGEQDATEQDASELRSLIAACLQKEPAARPAAADAYAKLRSFQLSGAALPSRSARITPSTADCDQAGMLRRHAVTTLVGGCLGAVFGGLSMGNLHRPIGKIESIAVLTLRPSGAVRAGEGADGMPIADRMISEGEILASTLVNELSSIDGLMVLPFRPLGAETPEQFKTLGAELGVDAFVTGTFEYPSQGGSRYWALNWQLVSATNGSVIVGQRFVIDESIDRSGGQFLAQSEVAADIAQRIGRVLVTSGQKPNVPVAAAYGCMMKGHAYADADSAAGLQTALACFEHALEEDPGLSEPLAAIAVVSMNLAARSDSQDSLVHLEKARTSMTAALEKNPNSVDARLAEAMLEWQSLHHYDQALTLFDELHREGRFDFQVQHQRGLFLAALGQREAAFDALQTASKLNPMSVLIKTDRCRVDWFLGFETRGIRDAQRYQAELQSNNPARVLATGLLIDYYEHQRDYGKAAAEQGFVVSGDDPQGYFRQRRERLDQYPYGPFGSSMNQAILDLRSERNVEEGMLAVLNESGATMFPLLLAQHPAFAVLRALPGAAAYLPPVALQGMAFQDR